MRAHVLVLLATALLASACQGTARGRRSTRGDAVTGEPGRAEPVRVDPTRPDVPPAAPRRDPGCIPGTPSMRVVWEALHVERQQALMPKSGRPGIQGIGTTPEFEVVLLHSSFDGTPEQFDDIRAKRKSGGVSKLTDREMLDLVDSLRSAGFYDHAKPTSSLEPLFASDRSRGRITIEADGRSMTLLSQRGLGLAEATKEIPGIYAEAKRAIQVLRNRARALEVTGSRVSGHAPVRASDAAEPPSGKRAR